LQISNQILRLQFIQPKGGNRMDRKKSFLITNFAYGTGPYLRTTELAIAFNDELERYGFPRFGIIVPHVYGEKQRRIMLEEFSGFLEKHPDELFLDERLGAFLKKIFYGENTYEEALMKWAEVVEDVSVEIQEYLKGDVKARKFSGDEKIIAGKNILVELNRSPRISYGLPSSYFTSFAYTEQILRNAAGIGGDIAIGREILLRGAEVARKIENEQTKHCIAFPATFSARKDCQPWRKKEILVPPIAPSPSPNYEKIKEGIYVTATGIPGLERLYSEVKNLGLGIYSNDVKAVPGSIFALPWIIPNKNIIFQFARTGWGSIWTSILSGTPLVAPDFDAYDDPEIYFNNHLIEELGVGIVYRGQPLSEIYEQAGEVKIKSRVYTQQILEKWGTLDGTAFSGKIFARHFIGTIR